MIDESLRVGQVINCSGCFTEEFFLKGLTAQQIGTELGLPQRCLAEGMFVSYAIQLPSFYQFELGGWAKYSTDKFVAYRKNKMNWKQKEFDKIYDGKRMPISIAEAKRGWLENMKYHKLIKILLPIAYLNTDEFPAGGKASQIIVTDPIPCEVVKFLKPNELFQGVWN